jgi:para-nitrobenzyl esterase
MVETAGNSGTDALVVSVAQGQLRGSATDGVISFKGVPYAAAPFGPLRFAAPAPAPSWDGVRDATAYGPTAPKPGYPPPVDQILPEVVVPGEECLNLNVWTPALDDARRPVLVWIHGGAFVNGSGAIPTYDGSRFARDGVVCVTLNYRLGAEGFLLLDDAPANRGLLDQVAALEWVRDNIAAFGGDPDQVTVFGESAGAMSVITLLSMPAAQGLFHRAVAQSGGGHNAMSRGTAQKVTAALAERLGVEASAAGFAAVPPADLVAAQAALSAAIATAPDPRVWGEIATHSMAWEPCVDGEVVPALPIERIAQGVGADVELMVGHNSDEHAFFLVPTGIVDHISDEHLRRVLTGLGADPDAVLSVYRAGALDASPGDLMVSTVGDWFFRIPAVRLAEARAAHGAETHVYEFTWRSPQFGGRLGACHALEIGFVFDNVDDPAGAPLAGPDRPQSLADEMHRAWVDYAAKGEPGWAPYGERRTVCRFGLPTEVVDDPAPERREVWHGVR